MKYRENAKYKPLDQEEVGMMMIILNVEINWKNIKLPEKELPLASKIVKKRIDVMKLPLKYNTTGITSVSLFVDRAGFAVLFLIDCLNILIPLNLDMTCKNICMYVYPHGFYTDESAINIIDEFIKTRKIKYAEIY